MNSAILTILMLVVSNVFMTFAWYGHLRLGELGITKNWPLYAVILFSWGIALAEYAFQVPANRIGYAGNGGPFSPHSCFKGSRYDGIISWHSCFLSELCIFHSSTRLNDRVGSL